MQGEDDYYQHSVYCLRHSVRVIELWNFKGLDSQINLAKFLIKNAMVLERMSLTECDGPVMKILEAKTKLEEMKASKTAKITLS